MPTPEETKTELEIEKLKKEVAALNRPPPTIWAKLRENWQTTAITLLVATFAVFPNYLIEQIKGSLNRADERFVQFRQLSEDLSEHIFNCEVFEEYYQKGWTTKEGLTPVANDYNRSITTLRKREQLYYAIIKRYWRSQHLAQFEKLMGEVKELDSAVHELNPEAEKVVNGTQAKADPKVVVPILSRIHPHVQQLTRDTSDLLAALMR